MTLTQLRELMEGVGLARVADDLMRLVQPCIGIRTCRVDEGMLPIGASKVGGLPDLPADVPWPEVGGLPARFLSQLSLRHIRPHDGMNLLPRDGLLLFFLGLVEQREFQGLVLYLPEDAAVSLQRTLPPLPTTMPAKPSRIRAGLSLLMPFLSWLYPPPEPSFMRYHSCRAEFAPMLSLPDLSSVFMESLQLTGQEDESYVQLLEALAEHQKNYPHQLLGYPEQVQGDVQLEVADQEYRGNSYDDFNPSEQAERAARWPLLMQFDFDDEADMDWGDGLLYFCIERDALKDCEFRAVRVVHQFT